MNDKQKSAAVVTINRPDDMTKKGRREIAKWLRKQADFLEKTDSQKFAGRFTARYLYN